MTLAIVKVLPEPVTPEQGLVRQAVLEAVDELCDGLGLVAGRLIIGLELKWTRSVGHESSPPSGCIQAWDG